MRNPLLRLASTGAVAFALFAGNAAAQTSTGSNLDAYGQDLAWSFIQGTYTMPVTGTSLANAWYVNPHFYPGCSWVNTCPAEGDARWISINPAAGESAPASYTYFHVFDVAQGGILTGQWSSDNGSSIWLNGTLLGTVGDVAFGSWHDFSGTLKKGQNVIAIQTNNITCAGCYNPGGVIANFQSTTVTPEPVSMALLGTGLAGVVGARRRRKAPRDDA